MRYCSTCGKGYDSAEIFFCLDDGTALAAVAYAATAGDGGTDLQIRREPDEGLNPGTQVGEYVIERKIGEGGMGMIFAASHPIIGKRVAIKLLNRAMASNHDIVQRFIQEAKSVNQIRHRNIVDIFSFGTLGDGRSYFAMEFLEGESLADRLHREAIAWEEALGIWLQIAAAIEAAHGRGIVHRDLKPDNVFVTPTPEGPFVKVLDFGIAKLLGDTGIGMTRTSTGMPIGTPTYMSPEQAAGAPVDHRADLYAFGVILFECVTGRPPFQAATIIELLHSHMNVPAPEVGTLAESVDAELAQLIAALLRKDPSDRPPSMREVRESLSKMRDRASVSAGVLWGKPREPQQRRWRGGWVMLGAAVAGLVVGGALLLRPSGQQVVPVAVTPAPAVAPPTPTVAPPPPVTPATGRVVLSTNTPSTRAFLDPASGEPAREPAAAGGSTLRFPVPPDKDWVLRVEAAGFKTSTLPLRVTSGEELALPLVLKPVASPREHARERHEPAQPPKTTPQRTVQDGKFLDPFGQAP